MQKIHFSDDSSSSKYSNSDDDDFVYTIPKTRPPLPSPRKCNSARAPPNRLLLNRTIRPNLNKSKDDSTVSNTNQELQTTSSIIQEHSNDETPKEHQGKKRVKRRVYKKPQNESTPERESQTHSLSFSSPINSSPVKRIAPIISNSGNADNNDTTNSQINNVSKPSQTENDEKNRSQKSNDLRPEKKYKIPLLPMSAVNQSPTPSKSNPSISPERTTEQVKIRRKVKKATLFVSDPTSITFYFDTKVQPQPYSGILMADINNVPFTPSFVTGNSPPAPSESQKLSIPVLQARNPGILKNDAENDNEDTTDNSIKDLGLNTSFMSTAVFNNLMEQNSIPNEELKEAIRQSQQDNAPIQMNRVPTLAAFEQNASDNLDSNSTDNSLKPSIAFSRSFFKIIPDDTHDTNIKAHQEWLKQVHQSRPIGLNEISQNIMQETSPAFKQISDQYDNMTNNPQLFTPQNRSDFLDYKFTTIQNPPPSDIITENKNGLVYIKEISVDAFKKFQFGSKIADPNPDQLHLLAWHNLKADPCDVVKSLNDFVTSLNSTGTDLDKIKSIIQYILIWIYYFGIDFRDNEQCAKMLRSVLNKLLDKSSPNNQETTITREICLLKSCIKSIRDKTSSPEDFSLSILIKPTLTSNMSFQTVNIIDCTIDPAIIVRHFSYIELNILKSIQRYEIIRFINQKFPTMEEKKRFLPNYTEYFNRFNETAVFIATSILIDGAKHRGKRIEYWIKVMEEARKFHNFLLVFEIDAALASFPISRLGKSWKTISKKYINILNGLHDITAPISSSIVLYKKLIKQNPEKTIPYIGPFLSELKYMDEIKKLILKLPNGKDAYNMTYQRSFSNIMENIFQEWGSKIKFQIDLNLLQKCKDLDGKKGKTEDLMLPSRIFEP